MNHPLARWLMLVALGHVVLGLAMPLLTYSGLFEPYLALISANFYAGAALPPEMQAFARWIIALFGPTVAAWGALMAYLVWHAARTRQVWAWNAILLSLLLWAPLDMLISMKHGFWQHLVLDGVAVLSIVIPVWILRKEANSRHFYS